MNQAMKRIAWMVCLGVVIALTTTLAQAQTICPTSTAEILSPAPGSTLPAGAVTFNWCNAGADYFLTVESVPGAHDIFNAVVRVTSVTIGPVCNVPTATNPTTQCIPAHGETIFVTLWTQAGNGKTSFVAAPTVAYTAATPTPGGAPADYKLDASTKSLTIQRGQSGSLQITLTPSNGFDGAVAFGCSGLPAGVSCQFTPAQLVGTLDGSPLTATLVVSTSQVIALNRSNPAGGHSRLPAPLLPFWSLGVGALGMVFAAGTRESRRIRSWNRRLPLLLACVLLLVLLAGCGGAHQAAQTTTPTTTQAAASQSATALVTASFVGGSQPAPSPTQQVQVQITILP